jgi:hypothetical protein
MQTGASLFIVPATIGIVGITMLAIAVRWLFRQLNRPARPDVAELASDVLGKRRPPAA